jgi:hypothetical protein
MKMMELIIDDAGKGICKLRIVKGGEIQHSVQRERGGLDE